MGLIDKALRRIKKYNQIDKNELRRQLSFIRLDKSEINNLIKDLQFFGYIRFDKKKGIFYIKKG
jgi:hypothetical protein